MDTYRRVQRTLIVILIIMVVFSFVAVINLSVKLEDNIQATNILIKYVERGR